MLNLNIEGTFSDGDPVDISQEGFTGIISLCHCDDNYDIALAGDFRVVDFLSLLGSFCLSMSRNWLDNYPQSASIENTKNLCDAVNRAVEVILAGDSVIDIKNTLDVDFDNPISQLDTLIKSLQGGKENAED